MKLFRRNCLLLACLTISWQIMPAQTPTPGQNVNMVSGTSWPYGDPFLERQDEPSLAVSTRNALHLLAGANDYRTVDLNLPESEPGEVTNAPAGSGEPWVGQYISIDGGARWQSTLLPGYPQDTSAQGMASPLHGFTTAADPVIASGTNGMFYYAGIAFNRGTSYGAMFVARYMDLNNKENGDISQDSFPIRYINTVPVAFGSNMPAQFLDKPALAVDIPRGSATCNLAVPQGGTSVSQTIPSGNVYVAYANVSSSNGNQTSTIYFSRSTNCGANWSTPIAISRGYTLSQGATIQVDPETGIVYVAWRVIRSAQQPNDGIAITVSLDGGRSFLPPATAVSLPPFSFANPTAAAFFDQNTTGSSFRTTAYPALAVGDSGIQFVPGPVYLAWSQRGVGPNGEARIMMLAIPGNASFSGSGFKPPTPFPLDNGPITNDAGGVFNLMSGFQLMPAMTFNQGKLMVLYYDLRQDHTIGEFTPSVTNGFFTPDAKGNFFEEARDQVTENPDPTLYSPYFISDAGLTVRRHTIDVVLAEANASFFSLPKFAFARVSHYDIGLFAGETAGESAPFHQLKFDPPNLPMFMHGAGAFMGDYLGIAGQPFVLVKCGNSQCWTYNNPSPAGIAGTILAAPKPAAGSAVHYATWTSNQDVIPPPNNQWDQYTAIGTGTSVYDGQTPLSCNPGFEGDRNQNVYSSRITQGLLISSPQSSKPLSNTVQRGFVVLLQNQSNGRQTSSGFVNYFRLSIANQPINGFASFSQLTPPSPVPAPPFAGFSRLTSIDVAMSPHTGIARTVFAVSSSPTASILINVNEIASLGGGLVPGGMSGFILLNADGTVPSGLVDPNGNTGSGSIAGVELYDPNVSAPNVSAPNVSAPNVSAPNVSAPNVSAANVCSPNVSAPNVSAPNVSAPNVSACGVSSPNVSAPNVSAPNVSAAPPSDATYSFTNTGNTTASYRVSVVGATSTPLQLLASQIYMTPQTDGQCHLITQQQNITLANVPNVPVVPNTQFGNPNVSAAPVTDTTISVAPGDTVFLTLRGNVDIATMQQIVSQQVTVVVQPHAVDSNNTTTTVPPVSGPPVSITTDHLPGAFTAAQYSTTIQALGGTPPYHFSLTGDRSLPNGFALSDAGVISGTTGQAGQFLVSILVTDSSSPAETATRNLRLFVSSTFVTITPRQPQGVVAGQPFSLAVTLTDATGAVLGGNPVTLQLASGPGGAVLSGGTQATTDQVGTAQFTNLRVGPAGRHFVIQATSQTNQTIGTVTAFTDEFDVAAPAALTLFGVNSADDGLSIIDPATAQVSFVGPLDPNQQAFTTPVAMSVRPSDGRLFVWNNSPNAGLVTVDQCTGLGTGITGDVAQPGLGAIAFSPDGVTLYGENGNLYQINTQTGVATLIGSSNPTVDVFGMTFDAQGNLWGILASGTQLVKINTTDGSVTSTVNLIDLNGKPVSVGTPGDLALAPDGTIIGSAFSPNNILFDVDPFKGTVSNIRNVTGGFPPQGMGFSSGCPVIP